jgi:hypothetical protein
MPTTYEPIATTTLNGTSVESNFTSIPSTYTDLRLVFVGTVATADSCKIRFNGSSSLIYSFTRINGNGATASSARATDNDLIYTTNNLSTTVPSLFTLDLFSYAGSTNKTCLITMSADRNGSGAIENVVGLFRSTSAITSVRFYSGYNLTGTATLYGIKNA